MVANQTPEIQARLREQLGSRPTAKLRTAGELPAVIYGHKQAPCHISLDRKRIQDLLHQHAHLIEVVVGSTREPCLVKDVQWNHLGSEILHLDLTRVDLTERVKIEVELELAGSPVGLKESGTILQHPLDKIQVQCLASQIPDQIKVDITDLTAGATMTIADLKLPQGVTAVDDPETVIASIQVLAEQPEEEVEAAAPSEPELIGKKEATEKAEG